MDPNVFQKTSELILFKVKQKENLEAAEKEKKSLEIENEKVDSKEVEEMAEAFKAVKKVVEHSNLNNHFSSLSVTVPCKKTRFFGRL